GAWRAPPPRRQGGQWVGPTFRPPKLDRYVLAFDVAGFRQSFAERRSHEGARLGRPAMEIANDGGSRLLRARPPDLDRKQQAARTEQCNELTPLRVKDGGLPPRCAISAADRSGRRFSAPPACRKGVGKSLGQI